MHLKVLRKHGVVDLAANGTFRLYRARRESLHRLTELLHATFRHQRLERAGGPQFYGRLLGWIVTPQGPGYALVDTPSGLRGSLVDAATPQVTLGVAVANLDSAVSEAEELGGSVVMPPTDNGWVTKAQVADPAGNVLTLIQR